MVTHPDINPVNRREPVFPFGDSHTAVNSHTVLVPAQKMPSFPSVKNELQFYLNTFLFLPKPVQWCYLTLLWVEIIAKPFMQSTSCHELTSLTSKSTQNLVRFIWLISFFTQCTLILYFIYISDTNVFMYVILGTLPLIHHYACAIWALSVDKLLKHWWSLIYGRFLTLRRTKRSKDGNCTWLVQ